MRNKKTPQQRSQDLLERLYELLEEQLDTLEDFSPLTATPTRGSVSKKVPPSTKKSSQKKMDTEKVVRCLNAATRTLARLTTLETILKDNGIDICKETDATLQARLKRRIDGLIASQSKTKIS